MPARDSSNSLGLTSWVDFVSSILNRPSGQAQVSVDDLLPYTYGSQTKAEVEKADAYNIVANQLGVFNDLRNFSVVDDPLANNAKKVPILREGSPDGYRAASNVKNLDGSNQKVYLEPESVIRKRNRLIQTGQAESYGISKLEQAEAKTNLSGQGATLSHEVSHNNNPLTFNTKDPKKIKTARPDKGPEGEFFKKELAHVLKPTEFSNALSLLQREFYQNNNKRLDEDSLETFIKDYKGDLTDFDTNSNYSPDVQRIIKALKMSQDGKLKENRAYLDDAKTLIPGLVQNEPEETAKQIFS